MTGGREGQVLSHSSESQIIVYDREELLNLKNIMQIL